MWVPCIIDHENARMSQLPRVDGVESFTFNKFYLNIQPWPLWSLTLTYDLDLDQCDLDLDPHNLNIRLWPLRPLTLTYDPDLWPWPLWPWPWPSWPWPRTTFFILGWKLEFSHFLPWWPWPLTYDIDLQTWLRYDVPLMCVPSFRSVGPMVQPAQCKQTHTHTHTQTDRHTGATENITSSANAGGNKEGR